MSPAAKNGLLGTGAALLLLLGFQLRPRPTTRPTPAPTPVAQTGVTPTPASATPASATPASATPSPTVSATSTPRATSGSGASNRVASTGQNPQSGTGTKALAALKSDSTGHKASAGATGTRAEGKATMTTGVRIAKNPLQTSQSDSLDDSATNQDDRMGSKRGATTSNHAGGNSSGANRMKSSDESTGRRLADTGGESPGVMTFLGALLAGGSLFLRRRQTRSD